MAEEVAVTPVCEHLFVDSERDGGGQQHQNRLAALEAEVVELKSMLRRLLDLYEGDEQGSEPLGS